MTDRARSAGRWVLLEGNRHLVAAALLAGVFLLLLVLGGLGVTTVSEPDAVRGVAGGLIPGLFTFLSIVLAINQLVLTQEFGSADEIRERVRELRHFREAVEAAAATSPSPVVPTDFLALVLAAVESGAGAVAASVPPDADPEASGETVAFADRVAAEARRATETLRQADPGRINAILPVLEYPDSAQLHEARRLRQHRSDAVSDRTDRALADLEEALELFSVARTHFRTNYTQRTLARLSRFLLYVGVPALLAAVVLHLFAGPPGTVLDRHRLVVVSALLSVALAPLAVLFSYILRIATVSELTIAVGPFVSRPGETDGETSSDDGTRPGDGAASRIEASPGDGTSRDGDEP